MAGAGARVRVVIVEDHHLVADALAEVLSDVAAVEVVGVADDVHSCLRLVERERPDVVLMDVRLPDGDGAMATAEVRELSPRTNVLLLSADASIDVAARGVEAGASGLLSKTSELRSLPEAIRAVAEGRVLFTPEVLAEVSQHLRRRLRRPGHDLTEREREVLGALALGSATDEIAEELSISVHTVRNHVRHLLEKLGARSKLEAVAIASREGLVRHPGA